MASPRTSTRSMIRALRTPPLNASRGAHSTGIRLLVDASNPLPQASIMAKTETNPAIRTSNLSACRFCGKLADPWSMVVHERTHTGERSFICPHMDCKRAFSLKGNLQRHIQTIHRSQIQTPSPPTGSPVTHPRLFIRIPGKAARIALTAGLPDSALPSSSSALSSTDDVMPSSQSYALKDDSTSASSSALSMSSESYPSFRLRHPRVVALGSSSSSGQRWQSFPSRSAIDARMTPQPVPESAQKASFGTALSMIPSAPASKTLPPTIHAVSSSSSPAYLPTNRAQPRKPR
ncbi:hypothetical protein C8F01DRAFT_39649 [Mycena amicta]|nr:hypothetical protein C8F01DRAFT_39649 [Mycena amicta]